MPSAHSLFKRTTRRLGIEVQRYSPERSSSARRAIILQRAEIDLVLDVGANIGQYAVSLRQAGYRGRIVSLEPLPDAFAALEEGSRPDPRWTCKRVAIGEEAGVASMQIAGNSMSSSLLLMEERHYAVLPESKPVGTTDVRTERLDTILSEESEPSSAIALKLDVQGFEKHALRSAGRFLKKVRVIEAELSLVSLYEGQPLYREVIDFLEEAGFALVLLEPGFTDPVTGHVLQVESIFVPRGDLPYGS